LPRRSPAAAPKSIPEPGNLINAVAARLGLHHDAHTMKTDFIFNEKIIVVFDLEWTAWAGSFERDWSGPGELREIIQFGAVKVDMAGGLTEIGSFECFARPKVNPQLSDYIVELTGITQEDIDTRGRPFAETWPEFRDFIGGDASVICCNGYDPEVLAENCEINGIDDAMEDLNFHSLRPMIVAALGPGAEPPVSAELARLFGLPDAHRGHTALGDSRAILDVLRHLQSLH
jgi:DNA polymerase III epsilon subunit-like protein